MDAEPSDTHAEGATTINNTGDFRAQRDAWIGNNFRAGVQNFNFTGDFAGLPQEFQHRLLPYQALFATGTPEQRRAAALNLLYYDGFDSKREQLSLAATSAESYAWIEETAFPTWLRRQDDKPCWIFGKPGSGKSTLMKFLAENKSTREHLTSASSGKKWHVIYFFFDYRGGTGYRNNIKGLLRLFIRQIISQIPSVTDRLNNIFMRPEEGSVSSYADELCQVIVNESIHICAFVDGLDEYEGDPWDIYALIDDLRRKTGSKFCLASRPESSLTTISAKLAGTEIFLHHNNRSAIKACIDFKLQRLQPTYRRLADCISTWLRWKIVDRAEGVILWASLAMDDVVKEFIACDDPSSMEFEEILDSLPLGLETLYDRILDKISPSMTSEAAIVLHLLGQYEVAVAKAHPYDVPQDCPLDVLLQACSFIQRIRPEYPQPQSKEVVGPSESSIRASIGDIVDIINTSEDELNLYPGSRWEREFPGFYRGKCVRLIHKSCSKYVMKSRWIESHLNSSIKSSFPNSIWRRFGLYILTNYPQMANLSGHLSDILQPLLDAHSHVPSQLYTAFGNEPLTVLSAINISWDGWEAYRLFCEFCTRYFPEFADDQSADTDSVIDDLSFPRDPHFSSHLHIWYCPWCRSIAYTAQILVSIRILKLYSESRIDLLCALVHGDLRNLERRLLLDENETRASIVSSLYDIFLYTYTESEIANQTLMELADLLTNFGAKFERRHLCGIKLWTGPNILRGAISETKLIQPTKDPLKDHDPDCQRKVQEPSILHHWVNAETFPNAENILASALTLIRPGIASDFQAEGSIFHAIINIPFREERQGRISTYLSLENMCMKFVVAAGHFLPSRTPSKHGLASTYAKKLRRKHQLSFHNINGSRKHDVRLLKLTEAALKEAEIVGAWGPLLEHFKRSWREEVDGIYRTI